MRLQRIQAIGVFMNYLGHLYLAGGERSIRFGNFIADHIKGVPLSAFSPRVADGIMMHRAIDYFTDSHPALGECRDMFRPAYRKYAGVVLDVVLDFFLLQQWELLSPYPPKRFIHYFYMQMLREWKQQPIYWKRNGRLLRFILEDRIWRYHQVQGICDSLDIMARTTSLPDESGFAREVILGRMDKITPRVLVFISDIVPHLQQQYGITPLGWDEDRARRVASAHGKA